MAYEKIEISPEVVGNKIFESSRAVIWINANHNGEDNGPFVPSIWKIRIFC